MPRSLRTDILVEHFEEIEILWSRRRSALWSPRETLDSLAELERRLDAHVDGLALDADGAHECFARGLAGDDADAAFASAVTLLRQRTMSSLDRVFDALRATTSPAVCLGIYGAIYYEPLNPAVEERLVDEVLGLEPGPYFVATRVLRSHYTGQRWPERRRLTEVVAEKPGPGDSFLFRVGAAGHARDLEMLAVAVADPDRAEVAIRAIGSLGLAEGVERLLPWMADERLAPAAGEAFWRITGLAVVPRADAPAAAEADETFEETRPWPDPERTQALWERHAAAFAGGGRWRYGEPIDHRRWLAEPHAGDLLTRREEITRLRHEIPGALAHLDLDAPAARQRNWAPPTEESP